MSFKKQSLGIDYPYAIISDVHCHNWSAFSRTNKDGVNNRLQHILDGIKLAADAVLDMGGKDLIITGDLFHTRGVIKPSVFNPTMALFEQLIKDGLRVHAIDGNHDDEFTETTWLGSSIHPLSALEGFNVFSEPTIVDERFLFIPWIENPVEVLNLATKGTNLVPNLTLFCHVGLSGVLPGNMGHTLNPDDLERLDIKYAFCGHFHNHVNFNSRVYSVGALTHQTWGDTGTLAGFVIVTEDEVKHYETYAPKFIDINTMPHKSERRGNYFRIKDIELTEEQAEELRKGLMDYGALAFLDQSKRPTIVEKDHFQTVKVDLGINTALETFCKHRYGDNWEKVYDACLRLKS